MLETDQPISPRRHSTCATNDLFLPLQTEQVSINVNLVEDVEVVEFSVSGDKCVTRLLYPGIGSI